MNIVQDKREIQKLNHMNCKAVSEIYKNVKAIHIVADAIAYTVEHYDFVIKSRDSIDMAIIPCQNRHCTIGYFYLNEKITIAIARKESEVEGEMKCSGGESENHRHQSCRGLLKYKVEITYV